MIPCIQVFVFAGVIYKELDLLKYNILKGDPILQGLPDK